MTQADAYTNSHGAGGHGAGPGHGHGHDEGEPHVLPLSVYFGVWGALVVLTAITVAVSRFDFGAANTVIAMFVATVKATLVALFFMHLYYDNKLNLIVLVASMVFVSIFFTPVLIDLSSRGALDSLKTRAGYKADHMPPATEPVAPAAPAEGAAAGAPAGEHPAAGAPAAGQPAGEHPAAGAPAAGQPAAGQPGQPAAGQPAAGQPGQPTAGQPSPAPTQPATGLGPHSATQHP